MFAVIGFAQESYVLREQTAPYTLRVEAVRGFLPQDMVLGVTAIPGTACKAQQHTQSMCVWGEGGGGGGGGRGGGGGGRGEGRRGKGEGGGERGGGGRGIALESLSCQ